MTQRLKPLQMVSLVQKLKMPKKFEKRLFEYVKFACEKDGSKKTPNIKKNESILKMAEIGHNPN